MVGGVVTGGVVVGGVVTGGVVVGGVDATVTVTAAVCRPSPEELYAATV